MPLEKSLIEQTIIGFNLRIFSIGSRLAEWVRHSEPGSNPAMAENLFILWNQFYPEIQTN